MRSSHYYRDIERILTGIRMVVVIANQRNGNNLFSKFSRIQYHASELFKLCYDFHSTSNSNSNNDNVNTTDSTTSNNTSSHSSSPSSSSYHTNDESIRPTSKYTSGSPSPSSPTNIMNMTTSTNPLSTFMPETWKEVEKISAIINSKTIATTAAAPQPSSSSSISSTSTPPASTTSNFNNEVMTSSDDSKMMKSTTFQTPIADSKSSTTATTTATSTTTIDQNSRNSTSISDTPSKDKDIHHDHHRYDQSKSKPPVVEYPYINTTPETNLQMKEKAVPSTHIERMVGFGSLAAGLLFGKAKEQTQSMWFGSDTMRENMGVGGNSHTSGGMSEENANRLAESLSRMRGAALKLGQMLSLSDEDYMPSTLSKALNRVRQGADYMPRYQLENQMVSQLGKDWKGLFHEFQMIPVAAASIGQVHRAILKESINSDSSNSDSDSSGSSNNNSGSSNNSTNNNSSSSINNNNNSNNNNDSTNSNNSVGTNKTATSSTTNNDTTTTTTTQPPLIAATRAVAVKIQYPGVAQSIKSDLQNLKMLITVMNVLPKGLFIDQIIKVATEELTVECDYEAEARSQIRYRNLILQDPLLSTHISVPHIYLNYCRKQLLVSDFIEDTIPIDQTIHLPLSLRNHIARNMLILTMKELFEWKFIQSDPNFSNFLYAKNTGIIHCIDFGAAREYSEEFIDCYIDLVWAAANLDSKTIIDVSKKMGFLSGDESAEMIEAHVQTGLLMGEPFRTHEPYDFGTSHITQRATTHGSVFMKQRLKAPPKETYSLHRKLAGAFLLCIRLKATIPCRDILEDVYRAYKLKQTNR